MGEFRRTPRMNSAGGRDHWGHTVSVLFGCGGMRMGQVIGATTPRGEYVADRRVVPQDVAATIKQHLWIDARATTAAVQRHRGGPAVLARHRCLPARHGSSRLARATRSSPRRIGGVRWMRRASAKTTYRPS